MKVSKQVYVRYKIKPNSGKSISLYAYCDEQAIAKGKKLLGEDARFDIQRPDFK